MWVALLVALAAASISALLLGLRLRARNRALAQLQRERSLLAAERDQLRRTTERQGQLEQQLLDIEQMKLELDTAEERCTQALAHTMSQAGH